MALLGMWHGGGVALVTGGERGGARGTTCSPTVDDEVSEWEMSVDTAVCCPEYEAITEIVENGCKVVDMVASRGVDSTSTDTETFGTNGSDVVCVASE